MSRRVGSLSLTSNIEPGFAAPLDSRLVVENKTELLDAESFPYKYIGMIVSVKDEGSAYILIDTDTTSVDSWKAVGSGESGTYDYVFSWDPNTKDLILNEGEPGEQKLRLTGLPSAQDVYERLDGKVDKVDGKGLSPEEYTLEEKSLLASLAKIKSVGDGLSLSDEGELTAVNGSGSGSGTDLSNYYTKEETDAIIANINSLDLVTVTELPTENIRTDCIYLLSDSTQTNNLYSEYVYIDESWERFGSASIDLTNYYTKQDVDDAIEAAVSSESASDSDVQDVINDVFAP